MQSVVGSLYYRSLRCLSAIRNISVGFLSVLICTQPRITHGFRVTWAQIFVTWPLTIHQVIGYVAIQQPMVGFLSILNCKQPHISHGFPLIWAKIFVTLSFDLSRSSHVIGYVAVRQPMVGFLSIVNCNQPRISVGFRVIWAQILVTLALAVSCQWSTFNNNLLRLDVRALSSWIFDTPCNMIIPVS